MWPLRWSVKLHTSYIFCTDMLVSFMPWAWLLFCSAPLTIRVKSQDAFVSMLTSFARRVRSYAKMSLNVLSYPSGEQPTYASSFWRRWFESKCLRYPIRVSREIVVNSSFSSCKCLHYLRANGKKSGISCSNESSRTGEKSNWHLLCRSKRIRPSN